MNKFLLITILLVNTSCIGLFRQASFDKLSEKEREEKISKTYSELNFKYYKMLENEIKEKDRRGLEDKYRNLKQNIASIKRSSSSKEHIDFLNKHNKDINLKLQYLKDLE